MESSLLKKIIMKNLEKILFVLSFIIAFTGISNVIPNFAAIILAVLSLFYLSTGWFLISEQKGWISFYISFLIAQSFIAVIFGIKDWPMKNLFAYFTMILLIISIFYIVFNKKSLSKYVPVENYLTRLIICLVFAMSPIWLHL